MSGMDFGSLLSSLISAGSGIYDSINRGNQYNQQTDTATALADLQKQLAAGNIDWTKQNNNDILQYILGFNPLSEADQAQQNTGNAQFAQGINQLRGGFTKQANDLALKRSGAADAAAGGGLDLAGTVAGDLMGTAGGVPDSSPYYDAASSTLKQLGIDPYSVQSLQDNAETAGTLGIERGYRDTRNAAAREAVRQGVSGTSVLDNIGNREAADTAQAIASARVGAPAAYENLEAQRTGRLTGQMQSQLGAGSGLDTLSTGLETGASNTVDSAVRNALASFTTPVGLTDPSQGLINPLASYVSPLSKRTDPYTGLTSPYTAKTSLMPFPNINSSPNIGGTVAAAINGIGGPSSNSGGSAMAALISKLFGS